MKYKDASLDIDERVEDLLSRMTLKEKVGQLNQKMYGWEAYERKGEEISLTDAFKEQVSFGDGMGALYGLFRADPWSAVTFENGIPPHESAKVANKIQRYIIENTRLGIPVLLSEECPHGHQALDGTMIPTNIGVGSTWNPELMEEVYAHVAEEVRSRGAHLGLISTLDLARDPRWGRTEECFSEDPYLTSQMTRAVVRGLQGDHSDLKDRLKIVAVLKHFAAQGDGEGGHNAGPVNIGERELREIHLPAMKAGVEEGALGCMAAYNEIDGIPCHANTKLLTDILRSEWGYDGFIMADGVAIDRLNMLSGSYEKSAAMALSAGVDLSLWDTSFTTLEKAVQNGFVSEELIDRAVRRILRVKFLLGLFDQPFADESLSLQVIGNERFQEKNLQVARESLVLLKNEQDILPLKDSIQKIAVIGPNADDLYNQLGDYTSFQREEKGVTLLQGLKNLFEGEVLYAEGCPIRTYSTEGFTEAVAKAKEADVIVLALGGSSQRNFDITFDDNGAAIISDEATDMDCGEGVDLAELTLGGAQEELLDQLHTLGKPMITVLIQGRPHILNNVIEKSHAVLNAWYPGEFGGQAIAEALLGKINPSGKLPVSMPRSAAQLPIYYNFKDQGRELNYVDIQGDPLFPFGYGLSYTTFAYESMRIEKESLSVQALETGESFKILINVRNTGDRAGAEVVQLYIKDLESTVTRRIKELKGFQKVYLQPGEEKTVTFFLGKEALSVWNDQMDFILEPGNVKVMIGPNSKQLNEKEIVIK